MGKSIWGARRGSFFQCFLTSSTIPLLVYYPIIFLCEATFGSLSTGIVLHEEVFSNSDFLRLFWECSVEIVESTRIHFIVCEVYNGQRRVVLCFYFEQFIPINL